MSTFKMCFKFTVLVFVVAMAHLLSKLLPSQTHWRFQGKAAPNSSIIWIPPHSAPDGMVFVHVWGEGRIKYDNHDIRVDGHLFFHTHGSVPNIYYMSTNTTAKAQMHLIAGI